jgi:hypothetical protein
VSYAPADPPAAAQQLALLMPPEAVSSPRAVLATSMVTNGPVGIPPGLEPD